MLRWNAGFCGLLGAAQVDPHMRPADPELSWWLSLRDLRVHSLVLPLVLPSFYSELFTLYLLVMHFFFYFTILYWFCHTST